MPSDVLGARTGAFPAPALLVPTFLRWDATAGRLQALPDYGLGTVLRINVEDINDGSYLRQHGAALHAAGLPFEDGLVVSTALFARMDGLRAMRSLLSLGQPPDAVFAYNDLIAIGAMRAIGEAGRRIPGDIAVIGIDDIEEGRFSTPTLTTVAPDKEYIGRLAVQSLIARIEGKPVSPPYDVQPPFRLITRESTLGGVRPLR